jgi:glutamine amidotransferase
MADTKDSVVVLDYGMSNLRSVAKALEHVSRGRHRIVVSGTAADLERAGRVVFPGQGAITECMSHLGAMGIREPLLQAIRTKPFLGICLGLQALMEWSAEGDGTAGLGLYAGRVLRFGSGLTDPETGERLKVPHMGWNAVSPTHPHPLWAGIAPGERFYFVHSYYVAPEDPGLIAATTEHGLAFASALASDRVFAVQFHPEKSQRAGLRLLENFLHWEP